jgi:hypothetical protein
MQTALVCYFVHHKSHMTWDGTEAATVGFLNYGSTLPVGKHGDMSASKSIQFTEL